jgi:hypothetical protein
LQHDGLKTVFLTFHGFRQSHDEFAGRKGDFDYLLMMAEVAAALELRGDRAILIRKPTLRQLPQLLDTLSAINGPAENYPDIYDYLGRAIEREDERPESDDLQVVPKELCEVIDMSRLRTEGEWVAAVASGDVPPKSKMLYCLNVDETSVDSLEGEPCEDILEHLLQLYQAERAARPTLAEVAASYGNRGSRRLYDLRNLERKWYGQYYAEHDPARLQHWLNPLCPRIRLE